MNELSRTVRRRGAILLLVLLALGVTLDVLVDRRGRSGAGRESHVALESRVASAAPPRAPHEPPGRLVDEEPGGALVPRAAVDAAPVAGFVPPRPPGSWRVVPRDSLGARIRRVLAHSELSRVTVGVCVLEVDGGRTLFAHDADECLILASNTKLVTTAAALEFLGRDFCFETRAYGTTQPVDGLLQGDLWIVGDGDPDPLDVDDPAAQGLPARLAAVLAEAGLRRVTGRLVIDDHVFDREWLPPGWPPDQLGFSYCPPVAGFSAHDNLVAVRVRPGAAAGDPAAVAVLPPNGVFVPRLDLVTAGAKDRNVVHVPAPVAPGTLLVSGRTPAGATPFLLRVPVADPALTAGRLLADALARRGVTVAGEVVLAAMPLSGLRTERTLLGKVSRPLSELLEVMDKDSDNGVAEHVAKRAAAAAFGRGTFANVGRTALETFERLGVPGDGARIVDGSGLSRGNRASARQLATVAARLFAGDARPVLLAALAEAGVDGTLAERLEDDAYRGRVRGKTGYIAKVSALTGLAQNDAGEVFAFSILMNGIGPGKNRVVKPLQDEIAALLVDLEPEAR